MSTKSTFFSSLAFNLKATKGLVRNDTMAGRPYTVVPMVMMNEGVLNGSNGPIFYPEEELAKNPEVWNHKPVVVYHPTVNGQGVTACSPDIISTQAIGVIMNTRWDSATKRLLAEAWLEDSRVLAVDKRVSEAIQNQKVMELSTGVFTDNEVVSGKHNGRQYTMIAHNLRPDHLAVLPDKIGACSVADGAGLNRNEDFRITNNEISHEQLRDLMHKALRLKYPEPKGVEMGYACPYVEAIYDDSLVFSINWNMYRIGYSATDAAVTLTGEPVPVMRQITYVPTETAPVQNENKNPVAAPQPDMIDRTVAVLNALPATSRRFAINKANDLAMRRGSMRKRNRSKLNFR